MEGSLSLKTIDNIHQKTNDQNSNSIIGVQVTLLYVIFLKATLK